jgi:proteasome accessory factor C
MVKKLADNQVSRLLDLVPYLTLNQGVALEKIASDFNTTKSAVLDDLNTLWMCGLPGYTPLELIDLSFETGYVSIRNADVLSSPRKLSDSETAALILGLSIIRGSLHSSSEHALLIDDLVQKLSVKTRVVAPKNISVNVLPEVREIIFSSVKTGESVKISYHSISRDEVSSRNITPLRVFNEGNTEHVYSFCESSEDFRVFRLDRISQAESTGTKRVLPLPESAPETNEELRLKVHSNLREISETFNLKDRTELKPEDEVVSNVFSTEWAIRTICSLLGTAEVLEPLDIRELVLSRAQKALNQYG